MFLIAFQKKTMIDPFPPKPVEYSMHLPEVLPPIKYKEFDDLHYEDKLEILTDEMVHRPEGTAVQILLRDLGISEQEYKEIISNDEYPKMLKQKTIRERALPEYPYVIKTMTEGAVDGDDTKMKSYLQVVGSVAPDNLTLVNQNIMGMTDAELALETEKLLRELKDEK